MNDLRSVAREALKIVKSGEGLDSSDSANPSAVYGTYMDRVPFNVSTNSHRNGPPNWQATTFSFGINATPLKKVYYWMGLIRPRSRSSTRITPTMSTGRRSRRSGLLRHAIYSFHSTTTLPATRAILISIQPFFKYASYKGKTYFIPIGWNNIMVKVTCSYKGTRCCRCAGSG
jgi:hypothetical protein